jgi:hypothetical protein
MDFNTLIDNFIGASTPLEMYVNDSSIDHSQNQYDALAYLQGEFLDKMRNFKNV